MMSDRERLRVAGLPPVELAQWLVETCLMFGASVHTAYLVAGVFLQGLERKKGK